MRPRTASSSPRSDRVGAKGRNPFFLVPWLNPPLRCGLLQLIVQTLPVHAGSNYTRNDMRDIHEVIREKESEFQRINGELDALRLAARLLEADEGEARKKSPVAAGARENLAATGTGPGTQFP